MAQTPVAWSLPARQDLLKALEYLLTEAGAPQAAEELLDEVEQAAASLADFPDKGRIVPELGPPRRELLVRGYRLVYRVRTEVEILRLIYGRQDFLAVWRKARA
jgi:toxin ParE1/3/4